MDSNHQVTHRGVRDFQSQVWLSISYCRRATCLLFCETIYLELLLPNCFIFFECDHLPSVVKKTSGTDSMLLDLHKYLNQILHTHSYENFEYIFIPLNPCTFL